MRYYILRFIRLRAFRHAPLKTLLRGLMLAGLILMRRGSVIRVKFGSTSFRFAYVHGKRHGGGRGIFLCRERIEDLMEFGDQFLRRGDVVIDGGANQGIFTTAFGNYVGRSGRVLAFEPMSYAVERIRQNCALNDLDNVTVFEKGLSDTPGSATLDLFRGVGSASITNDYGSDSTQTIQSTTIDETLEGECVTRVDFRKLDIEGAELLALLGATRTIERDSPIICLEISSGSGADTEIIAHEHLLFLGYRAFEFHEAKLQPISKLKRHHANVFYMKVES